MRNVETKLRSFVGEDEEVRHDGYLRTALCVERWLERRRKWRHINIVTAVATGRGWQAKRPQCFFSIPLILFARRSFLSLEKGPPFRPSTPVTRELGTRDCDSGQSSILGLAVLLFDARRSITRYKIFFPIRNRSIDPFFFIHNYSEPG